MDPLKRPLQRIKVIIIDDDGEFSEKVRNGLGSYPDIEFGGAALSVREGITLASKLHPDVVLMDSELPDAGGVSAGEAFAATLPDVEIIMLLELKELVNVRRALSAGARDVLSKPFSMEELATSVRQVHQKAAARRAGNSEAQKGRPTGGNVIVVYSPKGGVGCTTIAANLAVALKEETRASVALLDGDLQFGDVGLLMNVAPKFSISDVIREKDQIDEDLVLSALIEHSSGVKVLLSPSRPEYAELISPDLMRSIVDILSREHEYVVVDAGKTVNELLLAILESARWLLLVSTPDIQIIKNCRVFFDLTSALDLPTHTTLMVLNRAGRAGSWSVPDIEKNLGRKIDITLPDEWKTASAASGLGIPFALGRPGKPLSKAIFTLARMLGTLDAAVGESPVEMRSRASRAENLSVMGRFGNLLMKRAWLTAAICIALVVFICLSGTALSILLSRTSSRTEAASSSRAEVIDMITRVPPGQSAQDSLGLKVSLLHAQWPYRSPALQVPADQELALISLQVEEQGSLGAALGLNDFQLVTQWNEQYNPVVGVLLRDAKLFTIMDLQPHRKSQGDLLFYVRSDLRDVALAWRSSDGVTRLFGIGKSR